MLRLPCGIYTIKKIEKQSSIYKVGKNIQEKIFVGTANYDSNSLIDLNKITKDFESIEIPSLDSLIKK